MTLYTFKALCFSAEDKIEDSCNTFLTELNTEPCEATAENESDINLVLRKVRVSYPNNVNNVTIGHLNINSIRNKFEMLQLLLADYIDILMISESEVDSTFPFLEFQIYGFRTLNRLDRTDRGGEILLFVRENLITRLLSRHSFPHDIEILLTELNLIKKKWIVCCCYNPHKNLVNYHLQELAKGIQIYSKDYDDILLMGDFNVEVSETSFSSFCELYEVKSIINQSICYKNPTNP